MRLSPMRDGWKHCTTITIVCTCIRVSTPTCSSTCSRPGQCTWDARNGDTVMGAVAAEGAEGCHCFNEASNSGRPTVLCCEAEREGER
mmetsp:Transcript_25499/g.55721  ORF Transcript_25499/g.55721 Transcript_25499/m.55721 type:complete len:88 (+) Transcript_25499:1202-1465(+)